MNMILCDKNCKHQREGYCGLNKITQLTSNIDAKCGYFENPGNGKNTKKDTENAYPMYPLSGNL